MHLYDDLKRWAEKSPEQIFLLWRGEVLSYREAYSRVCAIAASLSPWRGQVLGLRFRDPPSQVLYFLGAMMAGAASRIPEGGRHRRASQGASDRRPSF